MFYLTVVITLHLCICVNNERRLEDCSQSPNITNSAPASNASDLTIRDSDADMESESSLVSYSRAHFQAAARSRLQHATTTTRTPRAQLSPVSSSTRSSLTPQVVSTLNTSHTTIPSSAVPELQTKSDATYGADYTSLKPPSKSSQITSAIDRYDSWTSSEFLESRDEKPDSEFLYGSESVTEEAMSWTTQGPQFTIASNVGRTSTTSTEETSGTLTSNRPASPSNQDSDILSSSTKEKSECYVEYECRERLSQTERTQTASEVRRVTVRIPVVSSPGPPGPPGERGDPGPSGERLQLEGALI